MSGTHKYPTISFRISPREREEIEAKIFTSGMKKKDYLRGRQERNSLSDCGTVAGNGESAGGTGRAN